MFTNSRDIIRRLQQDGFALVRVKGSHHQFKNAVTGRRVTVPHPRKDIPLSTVRSIYDQAGWAKD
jgi:predicted RNA binding protein YcfA (HicA-like mRNA interferase family)